MVRIYRLTAANVLIFINAIDSYIVQYKPYAMALSVYLSITSQGDRACVLAYRPFSAYPRPTLFLTRIPLSSQKEVAYFSLELCPKLLNLKISISTVHVKQFHYFVKSYPKPRYIALTRYFYDDIARLSTANCEVVEGVDRISNIFGVDGRLQRQAAAVSNSASLCRRVTSTVARRASLHCITFRQ